MVLIFRWLGSELEEVDAGQDQDVVMVSSRPQQGEQQNQQNDVATETNCSSQSKGGENIVNVSVHVNNDDGDEEQKNEILEKDPPEQNVSSCSQDKKNNFVMSIFLFQKSTSSGDDDGFLMKIDELMTKYQLPEKVKSDIKNIYMKFKKQSKQKNDVLVGEDSGMRD